MIVKNTFIYIATVLIVSSCSSKNEDIQPNEENQSSNKNISGVVQKGPFITGSTVTINELNEDLSQTGRTFTTTIKNDKGSFELKDIELSSDFIQLSVDGFYFNEISGKLSTSKITLFALANVSEKSSVNVNILTHLEKSRVEYLINSESMSFQEAKKKALGEILSSFYIAENLGNSEDIELEAGDDAANILIAISSVLLNNRTDAELTEFLSKYSTDLSEDGVINSKSTIDNIKNNSEDMFVYDKFDGVLSNKINLVKQNLTKRYEEFGVNVNIGDFERYVYDNDRNEGIENYNFNTISGINKADSLYFSNEITITSNNTKIWFGESFEEFLSTTTDISNNSTLLNKYGQLQELSRVSSGSDIVYERLLKNGLVIWDGGAGITFSSRGQLYPYLLFINGKLTEYTTRNSYNSIILSVQKGDKIKLAINPYHNLYFSSNRNESEYDPFYNKIPDGVLQEKTVTIDIFIDGKPKEFQIKLDENIQL